MNKSSIVVHSEISTQIKPTFGFLMFTIMELHVYNICNPCQKADFISSSQSMHSFSIKLSAFVAAVLMT